MDDFLVFYQPDTLKTLSNGYVTFEQRLPDTLLEGINTAAYALFDGKPQDHVILRYIRVPEDKTRHLVPYPPVINPPAVNGTIQDPNAPWADILRQSELFKREGIPILQSSNNMYSFLFMSLNKVYYIIIVRKTDKEFSEFLQGMMTLCMWFNIDWRQHILRVHNGLQRINIFQ